MLLAVDIGNTSTKFGIFDGKHLLSKFSIPTERDPSAIELNSAFGHHPDLTVSHAIVCSVVPEAEKALTSSLQSSFNVRPLYVTNEFDFGLEIKYEPLSAAGTDRLVNSFSAADKYGVPCIVCSFGTALTIDVVDKNRVLLGGIIGPGMKTMAKALHLNTALLPEVEIEKPEKVVNITTETAIRSGIFYGHIAMVEGIIERIKSEIGGDPQVVATGGFAPLIAESSAKFDFIDENLLLDGLRRLHDRMDHR
jgi:type III pantothenate kinase